MALTLIITDVGRAALVNAANTGTAPVAIASVGLSGAATVPSRTATTLPGEYKRVATLSGDIVADDTIHLIVRDESSDVFTLRSFGLYLADGTLFGIYGQADVILQKSAQAMMLLGIDVRFEDIAASAITFGNANFLNPPATTEQIGVVELATLAETLAGVDDRRTPAAKMVKDAVFQWLDARFGSNNSAIWHPGNDGAGSGMDADLLDGQQGSYYTNIPARLGFTPANSGGQIFGGPVGRDSGFYLHFADSNPALFFANDSGGADRIAYDRQGDNWMFIIAGVSAFEVSPIRTLVRNNLVVAGTITRGGVTVWDAGNDGAGSGLDADLLDGQQGSFYTNIPARLGFTPANVAGQIFGGRVGRDAGFYLDYADGRPALIFADDAGGTDRIEFDRGNNNWAFSVAGINALEISPTRTLVRQDLIVAGSILRGASVVWDAGNDGSGSGMDADLLDGQQGSFYTDIASRLGFTPVRQGGGVGQAANTIRIGWSGIRLKAQVDGTDLGNIVFDGHLSDVWRAANDGSGSGLDADLLDGQHGSWYSDITARLGFTPLDRAGGTMSGDLKIRKAGPTFTLRSPDSMSAMLRCADNRLYILRGEIDADNWTAVGSAWPLWFDLSNNDAQFGGHVRAAGNLYARSTSLVWDIGNDGAGSGLDADLLDGQQGSWYSDIVARLGYTPVRIGGGAGQGNNFVSLGWSGSRLKAQVDNLDLGSFLFDGDFLSNLSGTGYMRLPNGAIVQWGNVVAPSSGINNVTFPIAFPVECLAAFATNQSAAVPSAWAGAGGISRTGMTVGHASSALVAAAAGTSAFWLAIGK